MDLKELFENKRKDSKIISAIKIHTNRFRKYIGKEDRENIGLISLWKTLNYQGDIDYFIPFMCKQIKWECIAFLKKFYNSNIVYTKYLDNLKSKETENIDELLECLSTRDKDIIFKRYIECKTLKEIALEYNFSIEYINILIKKAIDKLQKSV